MALSENLRASDSEKTIELFDISPRKSVMRTTYHMPAK